MKINLFIYSALLLIAVSCQKESVQARLSPAEILTPGKWQLRRLTVEIPPGSGAADITSSTFDPCELDDIIEFKPAGVFSCVENTNVCAFNSGIFYNMNGGSWSLSGDTLLTIAAGFNVQKFKFGNITASSVELQQTLINNLSELTRYTFLITK